MEYDVMELVLSYDLDYFLVHMSQSDNADHDLQIMLINDAHICDILFVCVCNIIFFQTFSSMDSFLHLQTDAEADSGFSSFSHSCCCNMILIPHRIHHHVVFTVSPCHASWSFCVTVSCLD